MSTVQRVRAEVRTHPLAADSVLAAVLAAFVTFVPNPDAGPDASRIPLMATILGAFAFVPLAFRRRWPVPVLAVIVAVTAVVTVLSEGIPPVTLAALVAIYTVALRTDRHTAVVAWISTAAVLTMTVLLSVRGHRFDGRNLSFLGWTGMFTAAGDAVRSRRAYVAAIEERALRAERSREEEARRRVAEERLRIARELHDVVAHHIAVVNVQAGVASHLLSSDAAAAQEALGHVRKASRTILADLSEILNVLRQPGDPIDPTAPMPRLDQVAALADSFAAAGLAVDWSLKGQPRPLGASVDLVAYRLVQEALTNAHKHGSGTAHVSISYLPSSIAVEVTNPVGAAIAQQGQQIVPGHGLLGMRERAGAVGGTVRTGSDGDGCFRVAADLPAPAEELP